MFIQTPNLNGNLRRIIFTEDYRCCIETAVQPERTLRLLSDSPFSPPLSVFEFDDIIASELEFENEQVEVYDNPEDFIASLHNERVIHQQANRE